MSLTQKLVSIGVVVVVGMGITSWVIWSSCSSTQQTLAANAERTSQNNLCKDMVTNLDELQLGAMEAILERADGPPTGERLAEITKPAKFIKENLAKLSEFADTPQEQQDAKTVADNVVPMLKVIETDLIELIDSSGNLAAKTKADFERIDDVLDEYGDSVGESLTAFGESLQKRSEASNSETATAKLSKDTALLGALSKSLGQLMLAAMDAIIDRNSGTIDEERMAVIDKSVKFLSDNLNQLDKMASTKEEEKWAAVVRQDIPKLGNAIRVDLKTLIERNAQAMLAAEKDFATIDDQIDGYGKIVGTKLKDISNSVAEEQKEAAEALKSDMKWTVRLSMGIIWATAIVLTVVLTLVGRSITRPINRITANLTCGADQTTSAAEQVSASSQSLAQGASEQAASLEETTASMEEMSSMTKQNADNAGQANNLAEIAWNSAKKGTEAMDRMSLAINEIKQSSDETAKIIKTIDEIAFQTNLLALNAAVEAARAGEAGKGFAVVAEEVRNLAQRSAEAARTTSDMIAESVKNADNGVIISKEVAEALDEIAEGSRKVNDLVGEISAASSEQAQGLDQISTTINQMDQVTQSNAASAEESASASEELSAQAEELRGMVKELQAIVGCSDSNNSSTDKPHPQKHKRADQLTRNANFGNSTPPDSREAVSLEGEAELCSF